MVNTWRIFGYYEPTVWQGRAVLQAVLEKWRNRYFQAILITSKSFGFAFGKVFARLLTERLRRI